MKPFHRIGIDDSFHFSSFLQHAPLLSSSLSPTYPFSLSLLELRNNESNKEFSTKIFSNKALVLARDEFHLTCSTVVVLLAFYKSGNILYHRIINVSHFREGTF